MTTLAYVVAYLGIVFFLIACIARFMMWSKMPMHVRWELYPVAHEGGGKAEYGGSYLEDSEWWSKKREVSLVGELKVMVPEILFLVALREHNKKLWTRSFPFHFGLYLVGGATALMLFAGLIVGYGPDSIGNPVAELMGWVLPVLGGAGLVLGILGAVGLVLRRMARELSDYTAPADLFNLVFFIVAFGVALVTFVGFDRDFSMVGSFVTNLVTFNLAPIGDGTAGLMLVLSVVLLAVLVAYIPTTHMSHFIGKYFAYHSIRWQDDPNLPGGKQEKIIQELLSRPVTWSAPHIGADGKKSWLDVTLEDQDK
ncbi:MAG: respiratory nitrate reductase subunit gamma [Thermoanaerobaculales bacterium]|nr:respiratory nitrate reductase subunit gamma [Thermoanaerobaculales bacterium]